MIDGFSSMNVLFNKLYPTYKYQFNPAPYSFEQDSKVYIQPLSLFIYRLVKTSTRYVYYHNSHRVSCLCIIDLPCQTL
jgi:hypothetical protein